MLIAFLSTLSIYLILHIIVLTRSVKEKKSQLNQTIISFKDKIKREYDSLFEKTTGFYDRSLKVENSTKTIAVRIYVKKEVEYSNNLVKISYDHINVMHNTSNLTNEQIEYFIKTNFIEVVNDSKITWLEIKESKKRKEKFKRILSFIKN